MYKIVLWIIIFLCVFEIWKHSYDFKTEKQFWQHELTVSPNSDLAQQTAEAFK